MPTFQPPLSPAIRVFLEEVRYAVVATINEDGTPHQTVLWYELQSDRVMMNTRVGRVKERNLARDPRLSVCVEDEQRYVTLSGRAELDYNPDRAHGDIKALAVRYRGVEAAERAMLDYFRGQKRVTIHMTIEKIDVDGF